MIAKYNFAGDQLWAVQSDYLYEDKPAAIAVDASGNVYVGGYSSILKYNPQRQQLWARSRHQAPVRALTIDVTGSLYAVEAYSWSQWVGIDKYDPEGQLMRLSGLDYPASGAVTPAMQLDAGGKLHVLAGAVNSRVFLERFNSNAERTAVSICCGGQQLNPQGLAVDSAGNAYVASEVAVAKFEADGTRTWLAWREQDSLRAIAVDPSGHVFVAGYTPSGLVTIKYQQQEVAGSPTIIEPPEDIALPVGSPIVLSGGASGDPPLTYQWYQNGTALVGATNESFVELRSDYWTQGGWYSFGASNHIGETVSRAALVSFYTPATIVGQPRSRYAYAGENVLLSFGRGGEANQTQWLHNGNPLPGATNDTLALTNIQPGQAGEYTVAIWGPHSSATSEVARVTVFATNPLQMVWSHVFETSSNFLEDAQGIISDGDDSIYLTGARRYYYGGYVNWARKYDHDGSQIWNTTSSWTGYRLRVGPGNTLAAHSTTYDTWGGHDGGFRRLDYDANGTIVATLERHGTNLMETPNVGVDLAGNVYVGGGGQRVVKYRADGRQVWNITVAEFTETMAVDDGGNVFLAGRTGGWPRSRSSPRTACNSGVPVFPVGRLLGR